MSDFKRITKCRVCESIRLRRYLNLGKQPLANALLNKSSDKSEAYPLEVLFCLDCSLSQLSGVVDPEILYTNYPYHSSVSETFKKHCTELAASINQMKPDPYKCVIDIASNDGCLLEQFYKAGGFCWMVGVEPSENLVQEATKKYAKMDFDSGRHLEFRQGFWSKEIPVPRACVITGLNVLAHVHDIKRFIETIEFNLNKTTKSFCVIEVPYLVDLLEKNAFDTIYHEHLSYFLLRPLKIIFEKCGMRIFKVERIAIHGGSIRIYACPKIYQRVEKSRNASSTGKDPDMKYINYSSEEVYPEYSSVKRMEESELKHGLYKFQTYLGYAKKLRNLQEKFSSLLMDLRSKGKKVAGFGASAKGISLMNYCGITNQDISYIADDTIDKQGKFTPGASIPIVSRDNFDTNKPDYIALLAWNFSDELIQKTATHKRRGGKYIIPIPEVQIK